MVIDKGLCYNKIPTSSPWCSAMVFFCMIMVGTFLLTVRAKIFVETVICSAPYGGAANVSSWNHICKNLPPPIPSHIYPSNQSKRIWRVGEVEIKWRVDPSNNFYDDTIYHILI